MLLIAGIHCDFFHSKGSGYGSIAPAYGAPAYGAPPAPATSYGYAPAAPASGYGYGAPVHAPVVYYEEEKVSFLFIMHQFYLKIVVDMPRKTVLKKKTCSAFIMCCC